MLVMLNEFGFGGFYGCERLIKFGVAGRADADELGGTFVILQCCLGLCPQGQKTGLRRGKLVAENDRNRLALADVLAELDAYLLKHTAEK